ncbi:MAG: DUF1385 domain-containing protein [Clostridia bacterium]|nr:DUF1385 domain-containing protein [Clostridia bacterium]
MSKNCCNKKTSIGGQALIEGVMMRGPKKTAMAVRHTSGEIRTDEWENAAKKNILARIPLVRGLFNFIESMITGYKCLMKSAEMSGMEELEDDGTRTEQQKEKDNKFIQKVMPIVMVISAVLGVALAVVLFMLLPTAVYDYVVVPLCKIPRDIGDDLGYNFLKSLITGVLKIVIFLAYMIVVSQMKDIKRVFSYHGAEHKTIFCYEHGKELTVENVREESRFHPRCGTSFMILMMFVGVAISMVIPANLSTWLYTLIKILMLPLVMGIGYELLKLAGRHDNWFTRLISAPGKWMQRITTKEPTDDMIECAITAFVAVIPEDKESDNW